MKRNYFPMHNGHYLISFLGKELMLKQKKEKRKKRQTSK
jgi:hypothetical protein